MKLITLALIGGGTLCYLANSAAVKLFMIALVILSAAIGLYFLLREIFTFALQLRIGVLERQKLKLQQELLAYAGNPRQPISQEAKNYALKEITK